MATVKVMASHFAHREVGTHNVLHATLSSVHSLHGVCVGVSTFIKKNFALKFVTAKMAKTNLPKTSPGEILKVKNFN